MPPRKAKRRIGYTFKEAADALDISISIMWDAYRRGELEAFKFGGSTYRITPAEFLRIRKLLLDAEITVDAAELIRQTVEAEQREAEQQAEQLNAMETDKP